jgi:hypothetical protein
MAVLAMTYQGRLQKMDSSASELLDAIKCSLYSPDVSLNSIKGAPLNQNSNQMKSLLASFFDLLATQQSTVTADAYKVA